jgi:hypothetical protein
VFSLYRYDGVQARLGESHTKEAYETDNVIKLAIFLFGQLLVPGVSAHPENPTLIFIPHKTKDGRIVYTNIPMRCLRDGILTCTDRYPIYNSGHKHHKTVRKAQDSPKAKITTQGSNENTLLALPAVKNSVNDICHSIGGASYSGRLIMTLTIRWMNVFKMVEDPQKNKRASAQIFPPCRTVPQSEKSSRRRSNTRDLSLAECPVNRG